MIRDTARDHTRVAGRTLAGRACAACARAHVHARARALSAAAARSAGALATAPTAAAADAEKVVNVYNWSDYIAEDTISKFEAATGIEVNYDVFDGSEVLEAKLLAGSSGYDVVVPTAIFLEHQIEAGVFLQLDRRALPNHANLDTAIMQRVAAHDPGNRHAIPYMWGTTGFGFNRAKVEERMPNAPTGSWDMLLDPAVAAKFADCGISLLDSPTDVIPTVLAYLGLDPASEDPADLARAEERLLAVRPHIRYFHSSQYINDLANGETCVAMGWSGDVLQARDRAAEAERGVEVAYTIPREGAIIWFDLMAIPVDAPHPQNAHAFLDFIMRPQIAADITNYVFYANANAASLGLVADEVKSDPSIYPTDAVKAKLFAATTKSPAFSRLLTRAWTRIRTGR